jgi:hypothetical protein
MKSGKRKRDDENDADDSSSEEERVEVKRIKRAYIWQRPELGEDIEVLSWTNSDSVPEEI